MSEDLKYEFNLSDPDSWSNMPRPHLEESFVKELERIGGKNRHNQPRFKMSWGMSEEVWVETGSTMIPDGWYLKYQLCTTEPTIIGYRWNDPEIGECRAKDMVDVPKGVMAMPIISVNQIGTPRWVMEEWHEEGDCNGIYDRAGYYFHRWIVQDDKPENPETLLKPYRDPDQRDLDILAQYVQLTSTITDKEIQQGVAADREKEAAKLDKSRAELRDELTEDFVEMFTDLKGVKLPEPTKADVAQAVRRLNK